MSTRKVIGIIKLVFVSVVAAVCAVAAVVCFAPKGFFSWFADNQSVSASVMNVSVESHTQVVNTLEYYKFDSVSGGAYNFTADSSQNVTWNTYDGVLNNIVYQAVIKIKISDSVNTVTVSAKTIAEYYLGDGDNLHVLAPSGNSLSSIVAFEAYYSDGEGIVDSGNGSLTLTPPETADENTYTFINQDKTLAEAVYLGGAHTFTSQTDKAVYVVLKYNVTAIEEISTKNIGNPSVESLESIPFDICDFSLYVA